MTLPAQVWFEFSDVNLLGSNTAFTMPDYQACTTLTLRLTAFHIRNLSCTIELPM